MTAQNVTCYIKVKSLRKLGSIADWIGLGKEGESELKININKIRVLSVTGYRSFF